MIPDDPYVCPVVSGSRFLWPWHFWIGQGIWKSQYVTLSWGDSRKPQGRNQNSRAFNIGTMPWKHSHQVGTSRSTGIQESKHFFECITFKVHCGLRYIGWFYPPRAARQLCVNIAALDTADPDSRHVFELFACDHSRLCFWFTLR